MSGRLPGHGPGGPWPGPDRGADRGDSTSDRPDDLTVPWSTADGVVLVLWSIIAQALAASLFLAGGADLEQPTTLYAVVVTAQVLVLGGGALWLAARGGLSWRLLGPVRPARRHLLVGVGVGVSGYVVTTILIYLAAAAVGGVDPPGQEILELSARGGRALVLGVVVAVLLAPLVEELIFRGILFQALRQRLGASPAAGISAFVFGFAHVELFVDASGGLRETGLLYALALTILGLWLAGAFHRSGSLVVPVLGHATFNGIALALATVFA